MQIILSIQTSANNLR